MEFIMQQMLLEIKALREAMLMLTLTILILMPTLILIPMSTLSVEKPKPIAKYISATMIQGVFQINKRYIKTFW